MFVLDRTREYEKNKLKLTRSDTRYNNLKQENTFKRKKRDNSHLISPSQAIMDYFKSWHYTRYEPNLTQINYIENYIAIMICCFFFMTVTFLSSNTHLFFICFRTNSMVMPDLCWQEYIKYYLQKERESTSIGSLRSYACLKKFMSYVHRRLCVT